MQILKKRATLFLLGVCLFFNITSHAQGKAAGTETSSKPFVLGVADQLPSAILKETRTLNVYLPEGYEQDSKISYPVIYLLDGSADEDFIHIAGLVQFLTMIEAMPKSIVIGIGNIDRKRDFTFPTSVDSDKKAYPTTGGSERFISFVEKELEPYVQHHYRTTSSKTIIGQSLGGLVATEILLKKPELFTNYVIISPSLWWSAEALLHKAPELIGHLPDSKIKVYLSVGAEGNVMEGDAKTLNALLQQHAGKNLKVFFNPMPGENHLTILHNSAYKGLEWLDGVK